MAYTKISPLGPRVGPGSFDCFFDSTRYATMQEALSAGDYVVVDFVEDDQQIIYFEFHHSITPEERHHLRLQIQHFPFGIDMFDDQAAGEMATAMFLKHKNV